MKYPRLWSRLYNTPLAIGFDKLRVIEGVFRKHLDAEHFSDSQAALNQSTKKGRASYALSDGGVAVIPVQGTLVQRSSGLDAESALSDVNAHAILMEIDSPGGEVAGLFDLVDAIYQARSVKPVWAIANENAYSAAYAIASAAERMTLPRSAGVGSIGVVAMHMDQSAKDAKQGYVYTPVFAGDRKIDGSEHFPLSPEAKASLQSEVDRLYELFVATVARNRGVDETAVRATEAGWLNPDDAMAVGLADGVATFAETLAELERHVAPQLIPSKKRNSNMEDAQEVDLSATVDLEAIKAEGHKGGLQEGQQTERQRIAAILGAPEAKGRSALAQSLALETDLDAESAIKVLSSTPEQPKGGNLLGAVMANIENPEVGADAPENEEDTAVDAMTARALSSLGHNIKKGS